MNMTQKELDRKVYQHRGWLLNKKWGKKLTLYNTDLHGADLHDANLRDADLCGVDLHRADLCGADLCNANLHGADLRGANLDFSCLPLWCGGQFKTDVKVCKQLVAHVVRIIELSNINEPELILAMNEYKAGWHREKEF